MEIQGLDKLLNVLDSSIKGFDVEIPKTLSKISSKLIRKVKLKTPVDSGLLRRSWQPKKVSNFERIVFNNVKYAQYVEYGHRTRGGKSFVDGVYMLEKSVKEIESELDKEFSIMIDNLFK